MRHSDILVVGAGMAGLMAAVTAAKSGLSVSVLSEGAGVISIGSGAVDFLGYVNGKKITDNPFNHLNELDKNTIIYAHGRLNGTMFGSLKNIFNSDWFNDINNHVVKLSTPTENTLWQVFSVYHIPTTSDYLQVKFSNDTDFLDFINMLKSRSQYDFNVEFSAEDKILTLSTCYNDEERAREHISDAAALYQHVLVFFLRQNGLETFILSISFKSFKNGLRRVMLGGQIPNQKLPFPVELFSKLHESMNLAVGEERLLFFLMVLAFNFFMRIGEV